MRHCLLLLLTVLAGIVAGETPTTPADEPGFVAPAAGEHPRLFFRKADVAKLRERAQTPEGQAILKRLRATLDGGDGTTFPSVLQAQKAAYEDKAGKPLPLGAFSISHAAGYGFLYQLTGEQRYADLGRKCFETAWSGVRDRDHLARYSWVKPGGALRAGPSLGWMALGYDLCHDGWDPAFRAQAAAAIQNYDQGRFCTLAELARGARHAPDINHWGPQVGGAALALLAIHGDAGTDPAKTGAMLQDSLVAMQRQIDEGWSSTGAYAQGDGAGCITTDNAYLPALQAWRTAGGKDFITNSPIVHWMTLKWVHSTVRVKGVPTFPARGMYTHNAWDRFGERNGGGLSGCGTIAQGFGALPPQYHGALLWMWEYIGQAEDEKRGTPFDTGSPYPHRAILSFVNWPFGTRAQNPGDVLPKVIGEPWRQIHRSQWKDDTDLVVMTQAGGIWPIAILGHGLKLDIWKLAGATFAYSRRFDDGSGIYANPKSSTHLAIDFSRATGADACLVILGKGAVGGKRHEGSDGSTAEPFHADTPHGHLVILTVQRGKAPEVKADGDGWRVGGKRVFFDGVRLVLEHLNADDAGKPAAVVTEVEAPKPKPKEKVEAAPGEGD